MNSQRLDRKGLRALGILGVAVLAAGLWLLFRNRGDDGPSPDVKQRAEAMKAEMAKAEAARPSPQKKPVEPDAPPTRAARPTK